MINNSDVLLKYYNKIVISYITIYKNQEKLKLGEVIYDYI